MQQIALALDIPPASFFGSEDVRSVMGELVSDTTLTSKDGIELNRILHGWSPQQIAGRMRLEQRPVSVSHETIYKRLSTAHIGHAGVPKDRQFAIVDGETFQPAAPE